MLHDLIIIGGGPAGVSAGIYAARKKIDALLITKDFMGQMSGTGEIDNYAGFPEISGMELSRRMEKHLKKFNIKIKEGEKVVKICRKKEKGKDIFILETDKKNEYSAKAVIVATGADPRPLEAEGEKDFIGRGVSYCSICDAPLFQGKTVVVAGGGNSGFEAALDLAKYAEKIFIFEKSNEIKADEFLQKKAEKCSKIKVFLNREIKKIEGKQMVQAIVYRDIKTGKESCLAVDGVFVQVGTVPSTGFLKGLVKFNERDEIEVDPETCQSSVPGIFAAGDVNNTRWKQVIIAAGEGAKAALNAYNWLQKQK